MKSFLGLAALVFTASGQSLRGSPQIQAAALEANESFSFARSRTLVVDQTTNANSSDVVLGAALTEARSCAYHISMATSQQCDDQAQQIPNGWVYDYADGVCLSASSQGCYARSSYETSIGSFDACGSAAQSGNYAYSCYDDASQLCFMAKGMDAQVLNQNSPCTSANSNAPAPAQPAAAPEDPSCVYVGAAWYKCSANSASPASNCQSVGAGWWVCQP